MKRQALGLVVLVCASFGLLANVALAQQPLPGAPPARQPRWQPAVTVGPDGRPVPPHGRGRMPGAPGLGPRHPPIRHSKPLPPEEPEHAEECANERPEDLPPPPNYWQGILMVNNARATSPAFLNRLLFRYDNPADPCDPKNQPAPLLAYVLNFGVLAFVFHRFGRGRLVEALAKRKQDILAEIATATKLKQDAADRLRAFKEKLENIAVTETEIRTEMAAQAAAEERRILAEAEESRARMKADAAFRIEQELKTARSLLLDEAVADAVAAAEALIAKNISSGDLDRMGNEYLKSIPRALSESTRAVGGQT